MTSDVPDPDTVTPAAAFAATEAAEGHAFAHSRASRILFWGMVVFVIVQSLNIAPELMAWLTQAPEAVPGQRTTILVMQGGSICGTLSLIALPTFPFTERHTRLRLWIGGVFFAASLLLGMMYLMR